jgi:hypothetical protein
MILTASRDKTIIMWSLTRDEVHTPSSTATGDDGEIRATRLRRRRRGNEMEQVESKRVLEVQGWTAHRDGVQGVRRRKACLFVANG